MDDSIPENCVQYTFDFDALGSWEPDRSPYPVKRFVRKKHCYVCKKWLPATAEYFHHSGKYRDGLRLECKSCRHNQSVSKAASDPSWHKERYQRQKQRELSKPDEEQELIRLKRAKQSKQQKAAKRRMGLCTSCYMRPIEVGHRCEWCKSYQRLWVKENYEHHRASGKKNRDKLRQQVLDAYGGKCMQCGETQPEFLAVDHINNDGKDHRKQLGRNNIYSWLRQNGFPQEDFQILCHSCNWNKFYQLQASKSAYHGKAWYDRLRSEVLIAYGGTCMCCGEARPEVLAVDHINGDGSNHRRVVGAGRAFYSWLRKNGFPKDNFQLLCYNCNFAKHVYGTCPHQEKHSA